MTTTNEGTQRDELASIITDHVHEGLLGYDACTPHAEIAEAADDILAAGYRKPRTITTVEELGALPEGSVLLDPDGDVGRKILGGWTTTVVEGDGSMWLTGNQEDMEIPAIVLYEPEAEVEA